MKGFYVPAAFEVIRDPQRCVSCRLCIEQCPNGVHSFDESGASCWRRRTGVWTASGAWRSAPLTR